MCAPDEFTNSWAAYQGALCALRRTLAEQSEVARLEAAFVLPRPGAGARGAGHAAGWGPGAPRPGAPTRGETMMRGRLRTAALLAVPGALALGTGGALGAEGSTPLTATVAAPSISISVPTAVDFGTLVAGGPAFWGTEGAGSGGKTTPVALGVKIVTTDPNGYTFQARRTAFTPADLGLSIGLAAPLSANETAGAGIPLTDSGDPPVDLDAGVTKTIGTGAHATDPTAGDSWGPGLLLSVGPGITQTGAFSSTVTWIANGN